MSLVDNYVGPYRNGGDVTMALNSFGQAGFDLNEWERRRQPYLDQYGRACITIRDLDGGFTKNDSHGGERKPLLRNYLIADVLNRGYQLPVTINAATLTKEQWIQLDTQLRMSFRQRLRAAADLEAAASYGGFNGYAKRTLEYQAVSDPGAAYVDMDAETDGTTDTPLSIIRSMPLPITHSDFGYTDRELETSRSGPIPMPLDTTMGEMAARRVGEYIEDQVIGNVTGMTYGTIASGPGAHTGTSTVYGYRTFADRLTKTNFTAPSGGGWVPDTTNNEILTAISQLTAQYSYGPFVLYHSIDWSPYMGRVYNIAGGAPVGQTLRSMILTNPDIVDVRRLDRLTSTFTFLFVDLSGGTCQMVNGMDLRTVTWMEKGGLAHRTKVMAIKVPRFFSDYSSRTGVLHGTTT